MSEIPSFIDFIGSLNSPKLFDDENPPSTDFDVIKCVFLNLRPMCLPIRRNSNDEDFSNAVFRFNDMDQLIENPKVYFPELTVNPSNPAYILLNGRRTEALAYINNVTFGGKYVASHKGIYLFQVQNVENAENMTYVEMVFKNPIERLISVFWENDPHSELMLKAFLKIPDSRFPLWYKTYRDINVLILMVVGTANKMPPIEYEDSIDNLSTDKVYQERQVVPVKNGQKLLIPYLPKFIYLNHETSEIIRYEVPQVLCTNSREFLLVLEKNVITNLEVTKDNAEVSLAYCIMIEKGKIIGNLAGAVKMAENFMRHKLTDREITSIGMMVKAMEKLKLSGYHVFVSEFWDQQKEAALEKYKSFLIISSNGIEIVESIQSKTDIRLLAAKE